LPKSTTNLEQKKKKTTKSKGNPLRDFLREIPAGD